jgi:hypothetical protein
VVVLRVGDNPRPREVHRRRLIHHRRLHRRHPVLWFRTLCKTWASALTRSSNATPSLCPLYPSQQAGSVAPCHPR